MIQRLNFHAQTDADVLQYFATRALQVRPYGYVWKGELKTEQGIYYTLFEKDAVVYCSLYVPQNLRGLNKYKEAYDAIGRPPVLTSYDCGIASYLQKRQIAHVITAPHVLWQEYRHISQFYGDRVAKRSQVFLMNHIDEGVDILFRLGADETTIRAFMLHPYLQSDIDFENHYFQLKPFDVNVIALALEYRKCANAFLCKPHTDAWTVTDMELYVGKLITPVRHMLVADKVQNQKDFLLHHYGIHARSAQLDRYFETWLEYLNVNDNVKAMLLS